MSRLLSEVETLPAGGQTFQRRHHHLYAEHRTGFFATHEMDAMMDKQDLGDNWEYCRAILPRVSRTFALNIGQLEGDMHRTVLLGYLLFRIADTFEDTVYQDEGEKIAALIDFSDIFRGSKDLGQRLTLYEPLKFRWSEESDDKDLVENGHRVLQCYFDIPEGHRRIIDPLIVETAEGMARFQERKQNSRQSVFQLTDSDDLKEYCYYVAGVVGVMLTEIFCQGERIGRVGSQLKKFQVHFGTALQLINILKDYTGDIARGWCYIPKAITQKYGIRVDKIEDISHWQKRGIVRDMMVHIVPYLDSTLQYIKWLPLDERSIRMFCIIPFILGYRTLAAIAGMKKNKVSREEVAGLIEKSSAYAESNSLLEKDYLEARSGPLSVHSRV
jgi:farnesyl-diphosphate farnesyltransferase